MSLKSIEIICSMSSQATGVERAIKDIIKRIEMSNKAKYHYSFEITTDMNRAAKYSGGVVPPLLIINGNLEFAGVIPDRRLLEMRLRSIIGG